MELARRIHMVAPPHHRSCLLLSEKRTKWGAILPVQKKRRGSPESIYWWMSMFGRFFEVQEWPQVGEQLTRQAILKEKGRRALTRDNLPPSQSPPPLFFFILFFFLTFLYSLFYYIYCHGSKTFIIKIRFRTKMIKRVKRLMIKCAFYNLLISYLFRSFLMYIPTFLINL